MAKKTKKNIESKDNLEIKLIDDNNNYQNDESNIEINKLNSENNSFDNDKTVVNAKSSKKPTKVNNKEKVNNIKKNDKIIENKTSNQPFINREYIENLLKEEHKKIDIEYELEQKNKQIQAPQPKVEQKPELKKQPNNQEKNKQIQAPQPKVEPKPELKKQPNNQEKNKQIQALQPKVEPKHSKNQKSEQVKSQNQKKNLNNQKNPEQNKKVEKPIAKEKKDIIKIEVFRSHINPKKMLTKEQEKNPFIVSFLDRLQDFLKKEMLIEAGQKIIVAMSGGVDSSVLFDAMALLAEKMKFYLYSLHFNHKLRGLSSERDEKLVNSLSKEYNVQYYSASGNVKQYAEKNSLSIEYAARQLRYNFYEKVARTLNANFVATAHTADDSAETFFLNLLRGSGLTGLSSIPSKRTLVKNVAIIRPFIKFRKQELKEYAKLRNLKWFEDETNTLLNYTRNKIRLNLIPKLEEEFNPSITEIVNQTSKLISAADKIIHEIVKKNYEIVLEEANQDRFVVKIPMLLSNDEFIQGEIIQFLWIKYFRLQPLSMQTIDRILSLQKSQSGGVCEINSLYFVLKDRNNLIFAKRQYTENIKMLINIPGTYYIGKNKIEFTEIERNNVLFDDDSNIEYFDGDLLNTFLEIRNWQEGDVFNPLGMRGAMKISDFLINEKTPLIEKPNIIVLTNKVDVIWIIGKRISDKFKVTKNTKRVIKAQIMKYDKK